MSLRGFCTTLLLSTSFVHSQIASPPLAGTTLEPFPCSGDNLTCLVTSQVLQDPYAYQFPLQEKAGTPDLFPMPLCYGITLEEATIDQLQDYMSRGRLSSEQIVTCYLRRMYQVDGYISCLLELNPDHLSIATALDAERAAGHVRGPLHGIPFLIKDNIASKDKMQTTAGSWALMGSVVPRDAFVVRKLREAGAVLMGKATLSEWADMRSNNYSEGYSARGGQARSPYNLTVNPGGSSSGSAAAVAANAIMFALGTETDGSVINPAERNSIVGIKPTVGLTSRAGVIPESTHQDSVGIFARTVHDATYILDAIHGVDPRDNYTEAQTNHTPPTGFASLLTSRHSLRDATFGLPWTTFWTYADADQQAQLLALISLLHSAGATILNHTELPSADVLVSPTGWNWDYGSARGFPNESEYTYVKVDFYNNIGAYLSELNNTSIRTLADIVAFNNANDGSEGGFPWPRGNPAFYSGQDGFLASLATNGTMDDDYWQALSFCQSMSREHGIDAALHPASHPEGISALLVPPDVGQTYQVAAMAGYPVVTIPVGVHPTDAAGSDGGAGSAGSGSGMPFGLALMGTAWSEGSLLKWASAIEDLQFSSPGKGGGGRSLPRWYGWLERNVPVLNVS